MLHVGERRSELRVHGDTLVDLASTTNESRLCSGYAGRGNLGDFAQVVTAHIVKQERPGLIRMQSFEVLPYAAHEATSRDCALHAKGRLRGLVSRSKDFPLLAASTNLLVDGACGDR